MAAEQIEDFWPYPLGVAKFYDHRQVPHPFSEKLNVALILLIEAKATAVITASS